MQTQQPLPQVFNYKEVDLSNLVLSKPEKIENEEKIKFVSSLSFDKKDRCIIQTPNLIYSKNEKKLSFELSKNQEFYSFIEKLKDRITEILYNNSEKFFKGKKFSYNWIYKALSSIIEIDSEGNANLTDIRSSEDLKIYDHFKERIYDFNEETCEGIFILNIKNIEFVGKSISISIEIDAIKLKFKRETITDVCLLESESSEEEAEAGIDEISDTESEQDFFS